MRKFTLKTLLLLAIMLTGGGNCVWGYVLPTGYEIKDVFIGTNNGDGTVTAETFSSGTFDTSIYGAGTLYHASGYNSKVYLTDFSSSYVAAPAVDASVEETVPTYVGGTTDATKNVMTFHTRGKGTSYGEINFNHKIITRGKLVFSVDLNFGGYNKDNAPQVIFVDKQGNPVLQLGFKCSSGDQEYFQCAVNGGTAYNDGTVSTSKLRDKYTGHSIRDIVIDMETGKVVYTLDCINKDGVRKSMTTTMNINIGVGKNIAGIRISRDNGSYSSQSYYTYLDNIELYTVVPTSATSHTYTINAKSGGTILKTFATSTCTEYQDYEVYLPKCILYNSKYYVLSDNNLPTSSYNAYYTMGTAGDEVKEVSYTLDESIVYYSEAENTSGTNISYSNGGDGPAVEKRTNYQCRGKDMGNQTAGAYTATVVVTGSTGRQLHVRSVPLDWNAGTGADNSVAYDFGSFTQSTGEQTLDFILTEGKKLILNGANSGTKTNQSLDYDYIIVRKTQEPVTVGANGYTTFASPYPLDLTDANRPEGLKAYKATLSGDELSFTAINQTVPAGTGLLLLGETKGGTYNIPVVASGDAIENDLVGVTTATSKQSSEGGIYYFVMMKAADAESPLEFAPLSTSSEVTIPAGKAYVEYDTSKGAKSLRVVIDGEATEVVAPVVAVIEEPEVLYNLAGIQVGKDFKGIVINQKGEKRFNK